METAESPKIIKSESAKSLEIESETAESPKNESDSAESLKTKSNAELNSRSFLSLMDFDDGKKSETSFSVSLALKRVFF